MAPPTLHAAIPAATLILLRTPDAGPPEILMVERARTLAFAAGALVFPGGRLDPADRAAAGGDDDRAHRLAAARETQEEVGIAVDPASFTYFARWVPDMPVARIFDTRFFVAEAPAGAVAIVDGGECVRALWLTAAQALDGDAAGTLRLIYPTRRNLERLAQHRDVAAIRTDAARHPPVAITPWRDGDVLRIPEGMGYPITAEPIDRARRG